MTMADANSLASALDAIFLQHSTPGSGKSAVEDCQRILRDEYRVVRLDRHTEIDPELSFLAPAFVAAARQGHAALARATLGTDAAPIDGISSRSKAIAAAVRLTHGRILSPFSGQTEPVRSSLGREWYFHRMESEYCLAAQLGSISIMVDLETVWVFPQRKLLLCIPNGLGEADILLDAAKCVARCLNHAAALIRYLECEAGGRIVALNDTPCPHMSHNLWNVQTGLANVLAMSDVTRIGAFLLFEGQNFFGDLLELFPESVPDTGSIVSVKSDEAVFLETLQRNLLTFTVKDEFFTLDFVRRVIDRAHRVCSPEFLESVKKLKSEAHPLVLTTIRLDNRAWIEQRSGLPALFTRLREDFPRLGLVVDGLSSDTPKGWTTYWMSMAEELALANEVRADLPPDMPVVLGVGRPFAESIVLMGSADLFIAPSGSGMAIYKWIFNMPGLAFSNRSVLDEKCPDRWPLRVWHDKRYRSDLVPTVHLSHELVIDGEVARKQVTRANFHLDWMEIYKAAQPLVRACVERGAS